MEVSSDTYAKYNFNRAHRILSCRTHIKTLYYFLTGAALLWQASGLITLISLWSTKDPYEFAGITLSGLVLPSLFLAFVRFVVRPIAVTRVELLKNKLIIRKNEHSTEIQFEDIESISLHYLYFVAGWMKIKMKDGTSHALSVALMRSEYILDAVMQFDWRLLDKDKIHNYRLTAIYYDHSWARLEDRLKNQRKLVIKYLLGSFLLTVAYGIMMYSSTEKYPTIFSMIFLMICSLVYLIFIGALLWILAEIFILSPKSRHNLKFHSIRPIRDTEYEWRIEMLGDMLFILVAIGTLLALITT